MSGDLKSRMMRRNQSSDRLHADDLEALLMSSAAAESGQFPAAPATTTPQDLPITSIDPDPMQPRRAMPEDMRRAWIAGTPIDRLLAYWAEDALHDLGTHGVAFDWRLYIAGQMEFDFVPPSTLYAPTRQWLSLLDLATSIYQSGLEQPVTVYAFGDRWRLLVGERRLLAFHLLHLLFEGFDHIPAIEREAYNPFAQASENGARRNLNAIATARQLALLLLYEAGELQQATGPVDHDFYRRAAAITIPRGAGSKYAALLGLPSVRMLQHYKALLNLPLSVILKADAYNWPEGKLRGWIQRAAGNAEMLEALAEAEQEREIGQRKQVAPSVMERGMRAAERATKALHTLSTLDRDVLRALPDSQKEELAELAKYILKTLRTG